MQYCILLVLHYSIALASFFCLGDLSGFVDSITVCEIFARSFAKKFFTDMQFLAKYFQNV